jgi:hypothetical protein
VTELFAEQVKDVESKVRAGKEPAGSDVGRVASTGHQWSIQEFVRKIYDELAATTLSSSNSKNADSYAAGSASKRNNQHKGDGQGRASSSSNSQLQHSSKNSNRFEIPSGFPQTHCLTCAALGEWKRAAGHKRADETCPNSAKKNDPGMAARITAIRVPAHLLQQSSPSPHKKL